LNPARRAGEKREEGRGAHFSFFVLKAKPLLASLSTTVYRLFTPLLQGLSMESGTNNARKRDREPPGLAEFDTTETMSVPPYYEDSTTAKRRRLLEPTGEYSSTQLMSALIPTATTTVESPRARVPVWMNPNYTVPLSSFVPSVHSSSQATTATLFPTSTTTSVALHDGKPSWMNQRRSVPLSSVHRPDLLLRFKIASNRRVPFYQQKRSVFSRDPTKLRRTTVTTATAATVFA